jgi:glycosyltransferase involved in cell wall biosynthesis
MRVGIDIRALDPGNPTGIGKYIYSVLRYLAQLDGRNTYNLYYPVRRNSSTWIRKNLGSSYVTHMGWVPEFLSAEKFNKLWFEWYLPSRIRKDKIDIFHGPSFSLPENGSAKRIVTVHDLSPVLFPGLYKGISSEAIVNSTRRSIEGADLILADSEHTRKDIIETYGVSSTVVRRVYLGLDDRYDGIVSNECIETVKRKYGLPESFIFHVGSYHPRKNAEAIIKALEILRRRRKKVQLVLSGKRTRYFEHLREMVCNLRLENAVVLLGYLPDGEIRALYSAAKAMVYPSLYEGFCLPIVEAMASGLPCVVANRACMPEIAGGAAIAVDPDKPEDIADAVVTVTEKEEVRQGMIASGYRCAKRFSWRETASQTLKAYRDIAGV